MTDSILHNGVIDRSFWYPACIQRGSVVVKWQHVWSGGLIQHYSLSVLYTIKRKELTMLNPERSSQQPSSPRERHLRLKTILPNNVDQFLDDLWEQHGSFPQITNCWSCEAPLPLQRVKFNWPVGPYSFYFPGAPAYCCDHCNKTYFPEPVRETLAACVEVELDTLKPEPPPRNPRAVALVRRYSTAEY